MSSSNHLEIERKFLVRDDSYKLVAIEHVRICQGYLTNNDRCSVRVRLWNDRGFITVKSRMTTHSFSRYEWEKEISGAEAEELLALALPGKIDKIRWIVPMEEDLVCEVDEFLENNKGLVLAEIELKNENQPFSRPAFIGQEVTGDPRYFNSYLSQHPFATW